VLLNQAMICPHAQLVSLGKRVPEFRSPHPLGKGKRKGLFGNSWMNSAMPFGATQKFYCHKKLKFCAQDHAEE
jgi:hypothetical protein